MSTSRKDYEAVAAALKSALQQTSISDPGYTDVAVRRITADLSSYFKRSNPAFNSSRFEMAVFGVIET